MIYLPNPLKNIKKKKKRKKNKSTIRSTAWTVQLCQQSEVFLHKKPSTVNFCTKSSNLADLFLFFISISSSDEGLKSATIFACVFICPFSSPLLISQFFQFLPYFSCNFQLQ